MSKPIAPLSRAAVALALSGIGVAAGCLQAIGDIDVVVAGPEFPSELPPCPIDAGTATSDNCVCIPGQQRCSNELLQICPTGGGTWEIVDQCASSMLCVPSEPRCRPAQCARREHRCTATGALEICKADRSGFEFKEQCESSAQCSSVSGREGCETDLCRAGRQRCNAAQVEQCRADQSGFDPVGVPCASSALCWEDSATGLAGCNAPICSPGQYRCSGRQLQRCSDERDDFVNTRQCASTELCRANLQGCAEPACATAEQRCTANVLERCNTERTAFQPVQTCATVAQCDERATACLPAQPPPPGPDAGSP